MSMNQAQADHEIESILKDAESERRDCGSTITDTQALKDALRKALVRLPYNPVGRALG